MVPGIPVPPPGMAYLPMTAPPPLMQAVMPMQHMVPIQVSAGPQLRQFRQQPAVAGRNNNNNNTAVRNEGPPVTVFVGNITEKAPDAMIRHILAACGHVISWKRVKSFGFCELAGPDAGLRAVRILHDMLVAEKRLVAKVDAKTKTVLEEFKAERRKKLRGSSPLQDEKPEEDDYIDDEMQQADAAAIERINQVLQEYQEEMNNFESHKEEEALEKRKKILDEADIEEVTHSLDHLVKQEEEKEVSRRQQKEKEKEKKSGSRSPSPRAKRDRDRDEKKRRRSKSRAREKEAAYQERLRTWETRERRKAKEYEKEREKERLKEEEREREAKRLKEFLEDYDDERDDIKYYKGRELQRRLAERVKEAELDSRDRAKEKEELEELKTKVFSGEHEDPTAEFERLKKEREEQYVVQQAAQELAAVEAEPIDSDSDMDDNHFGSPDITEHSHDQPQPASHTNTPQWTQIQPADDDTRLSSISSTQEQDTTVATAIVATPPGSMGPGKMLSKPIVFSPGARADNKQRKKLELREVFNPDEDDNATQPARKRKLVPLDYDDKKSKKDSKENNEKKTTEESAKSQEEKRKHIKTLIDKIPTEKNALFAFQLDWAAIDNNLMEKRIRPWINKKIIEYIGEPEPTLVDFICSKVLAGSPPQVILDDVQMVLDEEAEVFVLNSTYC
ncbi:uncharacterized protein CBL_02587 [Carabus blaptoides fortunei]